MTDLGELYRVSGAKNLVNETTAGILRGTEVFTRSDLGQYGMDVIVIGGTGNTGSYLTPRLVTDGHNVTVVSRGETTPHRRHGVWDEVDIVALDRSALEEDGTFTEEIAALEPDVVIDLICFEVESAKRLVEELRGDITHFLQCGSIWVYGPGVERPTPTTEPRNPLGEYGRKKADIERFLLREARQHNFPATVIHPGHITSPDTLPLNPEGTRDLDVFRTIAQGETVRLPGSGTETLHHVHADDVAQTFQKALDNWNLAVGRSFHAVAPRAITTRGYAEWLADWFGSDPNLEFSPLDEWCDSVSEDKARAAASHIRRSPHCAFDKTRDTLDVSPRYTIREAVEESLRATIDRGELEPDNRSHRSV
jgi:nucleoside-diphosphate-sugar epimerase